MPDLLGTLILQIVGAAGIGIAAFGGFLVPMLRSRGARVALLVAGVSLAATGQYLFQTHRIPPGDAPEASLSR